MEAKTGLLGVSHDTVAKLVDAVVLRYLPGFTAARDHSLDDLRQECMAGIAATARLYDPKKSSVSSWVTRICHCRMRDKMKVLGRRHAREAAYRYVAKTEFDEEGLIDWLDGVYALAKRSLPAYGVPLRMRQAPGTLDLAQTMCLSALRNKLGLSRRHAVPYLNARPALLAVLGIKSIRETQFRSSRRVMVLNFNQPCRITGHGSHG